MKTKIKKIIGLFLVFMPIGYGYATIAVEIAEKINGATKLKIAVAIIVYVALVASLFGGGMLFMGDD